MSENDGQNGSSWQTACVNLITRESQDEQKSTSACFTSVKQEQGLTHTHTGQINIRTCLFKLVLVSLFLI